MIVDAWRSTVYGVADILTGGRRRDCGHDCLACLVADEIAHPTPGPDEPIADEWAGQVPRPAEWQATR